MTEIKTYKKVFRRRCTIVNPTEQPGRPCLLDVPVNANHFNRKRMVQDWTFRTYVQWRSSVSCFFCTMTFDEQHLPRMSSGAPCFCPDMFKKFFSDVRDRLLHKYNVPRGSMKYFLVSEYGKTTHRPHHHMLVFFDTFVPHFVFAEVLRWCWHEGFVDCEIPDSSRVLSYCGKYICKDVYAFDGNVEVSKDDPSVTETSMLPSGRKYTLYNFHRCSMGFGKDYEKSITKEEWLRGYINVSMDCVRVIRFAIPKYYRDRVLRKLEYYWDENGKRHAVSVRTPLGEEVSENQVKLNVDSRLLAVSKLLQKPDYYLDKFGLDVDCDALSLDKAWQSCRAFNPCLTSRHALEDYLLTKRFLPVHPLGGCNVLRDSFSKKVSIPLLWNALYKGFDDWISLLDDVAYIIDKHKQRFDEYEEFKKYVDKRKSGCRCY